MTEKFVCPDCDAEMDEVTVEQVIYKTFKIDYDAKKVVPVYPEEGWNEEGEYIFRCPNCDSLNVDDAFTGFDVELSTDELTEDYMLHPDGTVPAVDNPREES